VLTSLLDTIRLKATEPEELHGLGLDGMVCTGFFAMLKEVLPQINAAIVAHNIQEITLSGPFLLRAAGRGVVLCVQRTNST